MTFQIPRYTTALLLLGACVVLALLPSGTAAATAIPPRGGAGSGTPEQPKQYVIGNLDFKKNATLSYLENAPTFETYVNFHAARLKANFRFTLRSLNFNQLMDATNNDELDFVFTNPAQEALMEEIILEGLSTQKNQQAVMTLRFY